MESSNLSKKNVYVVIAGGEQPAGLALQYVQNAGHIICADSGAQFCYENNIVPEMIIGDLDSLSEEAADFFVAKGVKLSVHSRYKDHTDTDLALAWCFAQNPEQVYLTGALGKRIDHSLANIMLLVKYPALTIVNEESFLRLCRGRLQLCGRAGDMMSLIPLSPIVKNVHLKGFLYPLQGQDLLMRNNIGISNEMTEENAEITAEYGELLVIFTPKKE